MSISNDSIWLNSYFDNYKKLLFDGSHYENLISLRDLIVHAQSRQKKLIFAGNGASASISSHARVDFTKQAKCRAIDFNEPNLITAFANDYGYENFIARALECYADEGDILILFSVSGKSPSCVRAAEYAKSKGINLVSFTGMHSDNPLKQLSDISFWIDSRAYNIVESIHMLLICTVIDMIIGKAEYLVN